PLLGEATRPITAERIRAALALTRQVFLTLLFLGCIGGLAALLANPQQPLRGRETARPAMAVRNYEHF
ncbi:MAG: hypothetical protein AAFV46_05135, partial [Cyanobacteria bacterium J06635_11]